MVRMVSCQLAEANYQRSAGSCDQTRGDAEWVEVVLVDEERGSAETDRGARFRQAFRNLPARAEARATAACISLPEVQEYLGTV